jgi:hypothetical protein
MLFRADHRAFTTGMARYEDEAPAAPRGGDKLAEKIWVEVRPDRSGWPSILAELDTGAVWSILPGELLPDAEATGEDSGPIRTALGTISGPLVRARVALVPSAGVELVVEATILATSDWAGPPIIGYRGFLERLRLAIDPERNEIHFGPPAP